MFWPKYEERSKVKIYLDQVLAGLFSSRLWIDFAKVLAIYSIYVLVIFFVPLPFANKTMSAQVVEKWWLSDLIDKFCTGFALSNASIFSLGSFAIVPFYFKWLINRDFQLAKKFTKTECILITFFSLFISAWFIKNGIIQFKLQYILFSFLLILLGALLIRFFEIKLQNLDFGSISHIFIIIILFKLIMESLNIGNYLKLLFMAVLVILTLIARLYSGRKKFFILIWNISGRDFERSAFPVPFIDNKLANAALGQIAIYTIIVFSFLSFFRITMVTPASNIWLVFFVMITLFVLNYFLFRIPNPIITRFDPEDMSNILKSEYWTFSGIRAGKETSNFLSIIYKKLVTRSFTYVFFLLVLVFIIWVFYSHINNNESYLFRYSAIGLIILLLNLLCILLNLSRKVMNYGKHKLSKYAWRYGLSAGRMIEILKLSAEQVPIKIHELLLRNIDPIHVDKVRDLLAKCESKLDLLKILPIIMKYMKKDYEQLSFSKAVLSFIKIFFGCFVLSLTLFSIVAILIKMFNLDMHLSANEYFFLITSFITF